MKSERDEREELTRRGRAASSSGCATLYAPEPMDGARRTAFDARLRERLERRRWSGLWLPAFSAAALAALVVWNALPGVRRRRPPRRHARRSSAGTAWERRSSTAT